MTTGPSTAAARRARRPAAPRAAAAALLLALLLRAGPAAGGSTALDDLERAGGDRKVNINDWSSSSDDPAAGDVDSSSSDDPADGRTCLRRNPDGSCQVRRDTSSGGGFRGGGRGGRVVASCVHGRRGRG